MLLLHSIIKRRKINMGKIIVKEVHRYAQKNANEDVTPNTWAVTKQIVAKFSGEDLPQHPPPGSISTSSTPTCAMTIPSTSNSVFEERDAAIKRSMHKNFIRPMLSFPRFPKELHSDVEEEEEEAEIGETNPAPTHLAIEGQEAKKPMKDEKTEPVDVPPPSTKQMKEQYHEINELIDDLTKYDDIEDDVPIHSLKWKQCYKHAARKSTYSN
ncbi:hypothetical protein PVK06_020021 [Gossypium arboreum]|uniref:Uncharacterized protein n=1 Tax=Gossypium arboreum TaxID=29729 RepID=A0ABR0PLF9_GOSAR|nr:hypothetical protein PVK06_020021 [Gossypium arboreum]